MRLYKNTEIEHPSFLQNSLEWDIVELGFRVDVEKLNSYYDFITKNFEHLCFSFDSKEYLKKEVYDTFMKEGRVGNYLGNVSAWSVSWPVERDIPCPSKSQANFDMYPELENIDFSKDVNDFYFSKPQKKYMTGFLIDLVDTLGYECLRQILIARHPPGLQVKTHIDGQINKIHLPIVTNDKAYFTFGKNQDRIYNMKQGYAYLINTSVPHGTINLGNTDRVHLLSRVDNEAVRSLLNINCII